MGRHGQQRTRFPAGSMVVSDLPRPRDPGNRSGLQPAGRRLARHLRSAAQGQVMAESAAISGTKPAPIVEVQELTLEFGTYRGDVRALDHVSLTVGPGEIFWRVA